MINYRYPSAEFFSTKNENICLRKAVLLPEKTKIKSYGGEELNNLMLVVAFTYSRSNIHILAKLF